MAERDSIEQRVKRLELPFNANGIDPYGISRDYIAAIMRLAEPVYRSYFRVRTHGLGHIPAHGRAMLVGNHSGGVAIDGAMVIASCFFEMDPPRLAQGMADKFINRLPFASILASRMGQFTGLPEHALRLLEDDRLLVVFPEGSKGTAKLFVERHSLVEFGTGFMRLALQTATPVIPFAVLGGGEAIPTVLNAYALGKYFRVPYLPVTPYLLPLPLPAPIEIYYDEPLVFQGTGAEEDEVIQRYVDQVKAAVAALIEEHRGEYRLLRAGGPP